MVIRDIYYHMVILPLLDASRLNEPLRDYRPLIAQLYIINKLHKQIPLYLINGFYKTRL
jgi:hypothetical protein